MKDKRDFINNIKNFFSRKNVLIIKLSIMAFVLLFIVFGFVFNKMNLFAKVDLKESLEKMATDFYENFYYNQVEQLENAEVDKTKFLEEFKTVGIKISLNNLEEYDDGKYVEEIAKFVNSKTKTPCNKYNTRAIIYPKEPYGKTDYEIEINLECETGTNISK